MQSFPFIVAVAALLASLCALSNASVLSKKREPTLYLFGDSTMATCRYGPVYSTDTAGWGTPLAAYMTIPVVNDAGSGYSARQAYREKIYDDALARVQPGDIAILQWGRNDGEHFD
jgi:lysophospholipase L1-like esterase